MIGEVQGQLKTKQKRRSIFVEKCDILNKKLFCIPSYLHNPLMSTLKKLVMCDMYSQLDFLIFYMVSMNFDTKEENYKQYT